MSGIIALLTDFGDRGQHYVSSMKGVILKINSNAKIVDISHKVSSYSIIEASYLLKTTYNYFPESSIFIIVVDPGVGSSREILAIRTKTNYYFIGPNNGIFSGMLESEEIAECININNNQYFLEPVSDTFHGRDIMAPVGAFLSNGTNLQEFGPSFEFNKISPFQIEYEIKQNKKEIQCTIQYIDSFGNGTTNIPIRNNLVKDTHLELTENNIIKLEINAEIYEGKFTSHFHAVPKSSLIFLVGSSGYLEISKNQGNAAKEIGFKLGDIIKITL